MNMNSTTLVFVIISFLFILPLSLSSSSSSISRDNIEKACTSVARANLSISYNFCFKSLINSVDPNDTRSAELPGLAAAATRVAINRTAGIVQELTQYRDCVSAYSDARVTLETALDLITKKRYGKATLKLRAARDAHEKCKKLIKGTSTGSKHTLLLADKEYVKLTKIAEAMLAMRH